MDNTYNGWTNYETWNFNLWYGDILDEMVSDYHDNLESDETLEYGQVYEMVNGFIDDILEEMDYEANFIGDIIGHAIQQINIHEITENIMSEYE